MEFRDAQRIAVMLHQQGLNAWAVEGFSVKMIIDGKLYEIKESDERSKH
jgi:hypothetical protein